MKNIHEIRVFGIRRSGNHGIISWIMDGYSGVGVHLNDVWMSARLDPYKDCVNLVVQGIPYWKCSSYPLGLVKHGIKNIVKGSINPDFKSKDTKVNIELIRNLSPKDFLIHSYENKKLDEPYFSKFELKRESCLGVSDNRYEVIILRDPFNLFASLLSHKVLGERSHELSNLVEIYKQHAKEFLGVTNILGNKGVFINYNQWFSSIEYRLDIARKLGFETSGEQYKKVSNIGWGSSFSGVQFNEKANQMQVLERWRNFVEDPLYRDILRDSELRELSDNIFGSVAPDIP